MTVNEEELVSPGCPKCCESRIDYLVWVDEESVKCTSCGFVYKPLEENTDESQGL